MVFVNQRAVESSQMASEIIGHATLPPSVRPVVTLHIHFAPLAVVWSMFRIKVAPVMDEDGT